MAPTMLGKRANGVWLAAAANPLFGVPSRKNEELKHAPIFGSAALRIHSRMHLICRAGRTIRSLTGGQSAIGKIILGKV